MNHDKLISDFFQQHVYTNEGIISREGQQAIQMLLSMKKFMEAIIELGKSFDNLAEQIKKEMDNE